MEYKSKEETYFSWYLDELKEAGYIDNYEYEPESLTLSDSVKIKTQTKPRILLQKSSYSYDFRIKWNKDVPQQIVSNIDNALKESIFISQNNFSYIEIKGERDLHNMSRLARFIIKMVYLKYNMYIQLVKPISLFQQTFTPKRFLLTDKTFKPRKLHYKPIKLETYVISKF